MIWNTFNNLNGRWHLVSNHSCALSLLVEVLINLVLFIAGLLDEESNEANDSQASHSEADSVVPWEASFLLDIRGSWLHDSLEEDSTVFVSLVGPILVLIEVFLILILTNSGALRVSLIPLSEVAVPAILLGLIELLSVTLILPGLVALRVSLIPLSLIMLGLSLVLFGFIVFADMSLVLSGLVLPMSPLLLVQLSVAVMLTDHLPVVFLLLLVAMLLLLLVAMAFLFVVVPLSELLSQI